MDTTLRSRNRTRGPLYRTALIAAASAVFAAPFMGAQTRPRKEIPVRKTAIHGLTAMGAIRLVGSSDVPDNSMREIFVHPGVYRGSVINIRWSQIEPKPDVYDFSAIDAALRTVARYNAKYPATPVVGKLRVFSGPSAPEWLKKLSGGPFLFTVGFGQIEAPGWWTEASRDAWRKLQGALAAKYDDDPLVGEVTADSCAVVTDESFIYPNRPHSIKTIHDAGFTDAKETSCLLGAADDYSVWKHTPVDISFSPHEITDSGHLVRDYKLPLEIMQQWRACFGDRGVLSNQSVQDPISPRLVQIYAELKQMGQPIELETAAPAVIVRGKGIGRPFGPPRTAAQGPLMDWNKVFQNAIDTGANEVEIWTTTAAGGHAPISMSMLQRWAAVLRK